MPEEKISLDPNLQDIDGDWVLHNEYINDKKGDGSFSGRLVVCLEHEEYLEKKLGEQHHERLNLMEI